MIRFERRLHALPGYPLAEIPVDQAPADRGGHGCHRSRRRGQRHAAARAVLTRHARCAGQPRPQQVRVPAGTPGVPTGLQRWVERRFGHAFRSGHRDASADRVQGRAVPPAANGVNPGDVVLVPEPGYQAYIGGAILSGAVAAHLPAPGRARLPPRAGRCAGRCSSATRLVFANYPEQPDGRGRERRISREAGQQSAASMTSCWPTTMPTASSPTTATGRRASSRSRARATWRSNSSRCRRATR